MLNFNEKTPALELLGERTERAALCRTKLLSFGNTSKPTETSATRAGRKETKSYPSLKENEENDEEKLRSKQEVL